MEAERHLLYTASWAGVTVYMAVSDAALIDRAAQFLSLPITPVPKQDICKPEFTAGRDDSGWQFIYRDRPFRVKTDSDATILFTILLADIFRSRSLHPVIHAGAFISGKGAVIYLGRKTRGKTSHTFAAWRLGYSILGDDRIALRLGAHVAQATPSCIRLRIRDGYIPREWRDIICDEKAILGGTTKDQRWMLSRSLPQMTDYESQIPIHAIAQLRRIECGPSHVDAIPLSTIFKETLNDMNLGEQTPLDFLRFMKHYTKSDKLPRINVAPGDVERGVKLLAAL